MQRQVLFIGKVCSDCHPGLRILLLLPRLHPVTIRRGKKAIISEIPVLMVEFDFRRPARHCSLEDRPLMPGEEFCSALVETGDGSLERVDISLRAWTGPPENTVGWWRSRVPERDRGKVYWAPPDVLLAFFQHSIESNNQPAAFLTALILLRKRILNWKDTVEKDGIRFMQLHCARNEQEYEVAECQLDPQQFDVIQNELNEKLFTDQDDVEGEMHGKEASE